MDYPVEGKSAQECKALGNAEFLQKGYLEAIGHYTRGLTFSPDDIDLLYKRACAYLQFDCYNFALTDINTILSANPKHENCLIRKVKVLCGLRRYEDAQHFVENDVPKEILAKPDFQILLSKCRKMIEQSKGIFCIDDIHNLKETFAEYTGPVVLTSVPGKGRGIIAASDFHPGELIICSKAFAFVSEGDARIRFGFGNGNNSCLGRLGELLEFNYCLGFICSKLSLDPSLRQDFFELYPGPGKVVPQSTKTKTTQIDDDDIGFVRSIMEFNGFRGQADTESATPHLGVWILTSYLNHSCMDANAYFANHNGFMFIRAVREIRKGDEITVPYVDPDDPNRKKFIEDINRRCGCKLCIMEETETSENRLKVENILMLIQKELNSADLDTQVSRIWKLIELRKVFRTTNLALLDPCIHDVCRELLKYRKSTLTAAKILEKIYDVAEESYYNRRSVDILVALIQCHVTLRDSKTSKKWFEKLKLNLVRTYGSVRALKYVNSDFFDKARDVLGIPGDT